MFWNVGRVAGKPTEGGSVLLLDNFLCLTYFSVKVACKGKTIERGGASFPATPSSDLEGQTKVLPDDREWKTVKTLREITFICTSVQEGLVLHFAILPPGGGRAPQFDPTTRDSWET